MFNIFPKIREYSTSKKNRKWEKEQMQLENLETKKKKNLTVEIQTSTNLRNLKPQQWKTL